MHSRAESTAAPDDAATTLAEAFRGRVSFGLETTGPRAAPLDIFPHIAGNENKADRAAVLDYARALRRRRSRRRPCELIRESPFSYKTLPLVIICV